MSVVVSVNKRKQRVLSRIYGHARLFEAGIAAALHEIGADSVREVRRLIKDGQKTGRVYTFRGRRHQASAPHEAPANRTGRLMESSSYQVHGAFQAEVGEEAEYAQFLENGTKRMAPRPHLLKAANNRALQAMIILEMAVGERIRA